MSKVNPENKLQKFLNSGTGKYLDNVLTMALFCLIAFGIIFLFIASILVDSLMWGEKLPDGMQVTIIGARIYPGFFEIRDFAILLLIVSSFLYPIRL